MTYQYKFKKGVNYRVDIVVMIVFDDPPCQPELLMIIEETFQSCTYSSVKYTYEYILKINTRSKDDFYYFASGP